MDFFIGISAILFLVPYNLVADKLYTTGRQSDIPIALGTIVLELLICLALFGAMTFIVSDLILTTLGFFIAFMTGGMLLKIYLAIRSQS